MAETDLRLRFGFSSLFDAFTFFTLGVFGFGVDVMIVALRVGVFDRPLLGVFGDFLVFNGFGFATIFFTCGVAARAGVLLRERRVAIMKD